MALLYSWLPLYLQAAQAHQWNHQCLISRLEDPIRRSPLSLIKLCQHVLEKWDTPHFYLRWAFLAPAPVTTLDWLLQALLSPVDTSSELIRNESFSFQKGNTSCVSVLRYAQTESLNLQMFCCIQCLGFLKHITVEFRNVVTNKCKYECSIIWKFSYLIFANLKITFMFWNRR